MLTEYVSAWKSPYLRRTALDFQLYLELDPQIVTCPNAEHLSGTRSLPGEKIHVYGNKILIYLLT